MKQKTITRREFLRKTGAAAMIASAGVPFIARGEGVKGAKVALIRSANVIDGAGRVDATILEGMLDEAVARLLDVRTPADGWRKLIRPSDVVGIKTNVWAYLRTPPELERAIKARVTALGVDEKNVSIDDRGILSNPVFTRATALINVRPMRAHNWSGVGGCLKNYIMFVPSPPEYHPDSCRDLGAIWNLPAVKGKTRLNILVMLTPQFNCLGPHHFDKEFIWPYRGLIVGTDPVAVDAVGLKIIESKRLQYFKEESPMRPPVRHIRAAEERHGVGVADLARIEIMKLGWTQDILI